MESAGSEADSAAALKPPALRTNPASTSTVAIHGPRTNLVGPALLPPNVASRSHLILLSAATQSQLLGAVHCLYQELSGRSIVHPAQAQMQAPQIPAGLALHPLPLAQRDPSSQEPHLYLQTPWLGWHCPRPLETAELRSASQSSWFPALLAEVHPAKLAERLGRS